jgi:phosphate transport system substrate-binding protein
MKSTYIIGLAIVVIAIIIGSVFAYGSLSNSSNSATPTPTPSPTMAPTATPTGTPGPSATVSPSHTPTPTAKPTATPAPTAAPTIAPSTTLLGSGGTLVAPLMANWQVAYNQYQSKVQVNYNAVGSGTGISQFQTGVNNFGESDAPLQASDISNLPSGSVALTIPISASAVVPAYNLKLVNGSTCQNGLDFTGTVLANIFLGTITTWNDPAIKALQNPTVAAQLPSTSISVIHRSDGSGTMFAFTDYLSQASTAWASGPGKSKSPAWPVGVGKPGNAGVAQGIASTDGALGPLEIAYELQNPNAISYGAVQNANGDFVLATVSNIQSTLAVGATTLPAGDQSWASVSIIDSVFNDHTPGIYPIVTLTYALVYESQTNYNTGAALVSFLTWVNNQGQAYSANTGYAPLPQNIVTLNTATIGKITYNGNPIPLLS